MKKLKIILVDNDEDEQMFMREGFDSTDLFDILYQAKDGNDLFEFMEGLGSALPDLILSDLNMPGKNGYEILSEKNENPNYAHIPVVITSTSSTKTIIEKCINLGADAYMVKPETFTEYQPFAKRLYALVQEKGLVQ